MLGLHCYTGFSLVVASGGYSSLRCRSFSLWWLLLLQSTGPIVVMHGLTDTWDLLGSGIKPVSPALAGGFFTTEPPRKRYIHYLI